MKGDSPQNPGRDQDMDISREAIIQSATEATEAKDFRFFLYRF